MGTWSIESPSPHPLASIDQTGKVTFQPHNTMTSYTIKYTGTTAETKCKQTTIRGNIVVLPCVACSFTLNSTGTKVPYEKTSTRTNVATYSVGCTGTFLVEFSDGEDFLDGISVSGGYINAAVKSDNTTTAVRWGRYKVTFTPTDGSVAPVPLIFTAQQEGKSEPTPTPTCPIITSTSVKALKPSGAANQLLVEIHTNGDSTNMAAYSIVNWMSNLSVVGHGAGYYQIMGTYDANTSNSARYSEIILYCDNTKTELMATFSLAQQPKT